MLDIIFPPLSFVYGFSDGIYNLQVDETFKVKQ